MSVKGTSIECDARRRSFAMSANFAKSVSESAKRADRLDSSKRISSNRFLSSMGAWNYSKKIIKKYASTDSQIEYQSTP